MVRVSAPVRDTGLMALELLDFRAEPTYSIPQWREKSRVVAQSQYQLAQLGFISSSAKHGACSVTHQGSAVTSLF